MRVAWFAVYCLSALFALASSLGLGILIISIVSLPFLAGIGGAIWFYKTGQDNWAVAILLFSFSICGGWLWCLEKIREWLRPKSRIPTAPSRLFRKRVREATAIADWQHASSNSGLNGN